MGNTDQFHIGEHGAGPQTAIIQCGIDAALGQLCVKRFGGLGDLWRVLGVDHADDNAPRGHRFRPNHAGFVVALLDGGGNDAADADAVATHGHHLGLAVLVQHGGLERLGIFLAELEHMAHFDAARDMQGAMAVWREVALDYLTDIFDTGDVGVALPVGAGVMGAILIAAANEVGQHRRAAIDDNRYVGG
jgi:hypothetical protein